MMDEKPDALRPEYDLDARARELARRVMGKPPEKQAWLKKTPSVPDEKNQRPVDKQIFPMHPDEES